MFKHKSDPTAATAKAEPAGAVQEARTRARHRFIGAIVLLVIGVIGFPLVFETQPRPIPVDIPIEIPKRDGLPPLAMPAAPATATAASQAVDGGPAPAAPRVASRPSATGGEIITESRSDAGRDVTPATAPAASAAQRTPASPAPAPSKSPAQPSEAAAPAAARPSSPRANVAPNASPDTSLNAGVSSSTGADGERARALLEGRPAVASGGETPRFVLQVGAFAEADAARESRKQVERLGLKTYTQVAQTPGGSRIRVRVGPFATRAEADAALAKVKAAGHAAVVLTL